MRLASILILAGLAAALGGCRESEQGRPLFHKPGVYSGQPDEKLNKHQLEDLRARAHKMAG